ncbi:MAG TPA: amidohydrolase family protein [Puia sp.]|nr:amidohydrolase family protein [Puia sp.]
MHIDSEVHFWKYGKSLLNSFIRNNKVLQQDYLPEHLDLSLNRNKIDGCIAVVSENAEVETRFLSELAATHPLISAVVGWTDMFDPKSVEKIREFRQYNHIRGYRFELSNDKYPSLQLMEILAENQYSLDISISTDTDMDRLSKWMNDWPDQQFILRDCANPDAKNAPSKIWASTIRELAKFQNLSCKLSGLFTKGNQKSWKPADFYPFLEILFESFGSERLLYASDWPFLLTAGIYIQWKSLIEKYMERYTIDDQDKIFGENALRIYRL